MKDQFGYNFEEVDDHEGIYLSPNGSRTPLQPESERLMDDIINQNQQTSMYAASVRSSHTPGYAQGGFSPNDTMGSPAYYSPVHCTSPGYGSPINVPGASPIYIGQSPGYNASPIY